MNDEINKVTATMNLPSLPTERTKALLRLTRAAMLHSMGFLRQQVQMISAIADFDELSFRRHSGNVDLSVVVNGVAQDKFGTSGELVEAALAFAEADRNESLAKLQREAKDIERALVLNRSAPLNRSLLPLNRSSVPLNPHGRDPVRYPQGVAGEDS